MNGGLRAQQLMFDYAVIISYHGAGQYGGAPLKPFYGVSI